jgi:hypothetical protein
MTNVTVMTVARVLRVPPAEAMEAVRFMSGAPSPFDQGGLAGVQKLAARRGLYHRERVPNEPARSG